MSAHERSEDHLRIGGTRLRLQGGDITQEDADAIVNAANEGLMGGGGVDGAIHAAAGPALDEECSRIVARQGKLPTGQAVVTKGGKLRAKWVIHTVGPIWAGGAEGEPDLLASAYRESLKKAVEIGAKTVSFPSLSTGIYGYPIEQAAAIAINTVWEFVANHPGLDEVRFILFNDKAHQAFVQAVRERLKRAETREFRRKT